MYEKRALCFTISKKNVRILKGLHFLSTQYLKGGFFALFRERSGAVRPVQHPSRSQKIIKKYALLGAAHFCG